MIDLDNKGDNNAALDIIKRLLALRSDSDSYGQLLATLRHPRNRETIGSGDRTAIDTLFTLIDSFHEAHEIRLATIDKGNP